MAKRVQCVDGSCRCTYSFEFIDEYGCCTDDKPEKPDKPDKPEKPKTCKEVKCGDCQTCINPLGIPMCVCDKENGCIGNGKRCWLEEDMTCPNSTYGTCGTLGTTYPVPIGSLCVGSVEEVDEDTGEIDSSTFNIECKVPPKPTNPDKPPPITDGRKPTTTDDRPTGFRPKYGCCGCKKGWEDADGDRTNGCESKIDMCSD